MIRLQCDILYHWFIGYNLNEEVLDHSTYFRNYKRKFCKLEKDLLQTVFDKVIDLSIDWNYLDMTSVYIDSAHTKAYANKKKNHKELIKIEAKKYQKELDLEIALKGLQNEKYLEEIERNVKCNEEIDTKEVIGEKEIIVSDTDKYAEILYKNDKEKMFVYNTSVICDNNNYILTVDTNGSNVHNSVYSYDSFENLTNHFDISEIDYFVGDDTYIILHICKKIIDLDMISE